MTEKWLVAWAGDGRNYNQCSTEAEARESAESYIKQRGVEYVMVARVVAEVSAKPSWSDEPEPAGRTTRCGALLLLASRVPGVVEEMKCGLAPGHDGYHHFVEAASGGPETPWCWRGCGSIRYDSHATGRT